MKKKIGLLASLALIFYGCNQKIDTPKLAVFISIDQLGQEVFAHYQDLYTGGYEWFLENGVWFTNVEHEHWYCATAPGHFVLSSGRHPVHGNVFGNYQFDRELNQIVSSVADTLSKITGSAKIGRSYRNIPTTTLGDWLKFKHPKSKVISVAGKDRAAILMAGKNPDAVVWWNWEGQFVTSDYYTKDNPTWLTQFNENSDFLKYRDSLWTRELDTEIYEKYTRSDHFTGEIDVSDKNEYSPTFPIAFDKNLTDLQVLDNLANGPWLDYETVHLSQSIVENEELGLDNNPDILFIGLSGTDVIGHNFGPFSNEAMDYQLKLDKKLNSFIKYLDHQIGLKNVLFVLTGDHGVLPLPEYLNNIKNVEAGRIDRQEYYARRDSALSEIEKLFGKEIVYTDFNKFYYNYAKLAELNITNSDIDNILRPALRNVEGIGEILTKDEILTGDSNNKLIRRFQNHTHPKNGPDLVAIPKKYWTFRYPRGATHGTPYKYDSNVPFIIASEGLKSETIDKYYGAVNIAPTIAKILGLPIPEVVDGVPIY